ncbi:hypothetical protein B0H17DRAFT_1150986 [Mycena rosella]|uniref:Uncharacterized protein n=1 Tax=Mycena rosella TaxID=1033263 RepID=A0AAD7BPQ1_MYCRO|nr:hypothetical protein B0H17DRAFT_1150986 [Mycena rosella]
MPAQSTMSWPLLVFHRPLRLTCCRRVYLGHLPFRERLYQGPPSNGGPHAEVHHEVHANSNDQKVHYPAGPRYKVQGPSSVRGWRDPWASLSSNEIDSDQIWCQFQWFILSAKMCVWPTAHEITAGYNGWRQLIIGLRKKSGCKLIFMLIMGQLAARPSAKTKPRRNSKTTIQTRPHSVGAADNPRKRWRNVDRNQTHATSKQMALMESKQPGHPQGHPGSGVERVSRDINLSSPDPAGSEPTMQVTGLQLCVTEVRRRLAAAAGVMVHGGKGSR